MASRDKSVHSWRFFRAGGFDQVRLDRSEDLLKLGELDQKLWVALSCPVQGLELDVKTLELIDTDKDGRIRAPELLAAVKWACSALKRPERVFRGAPALALDDIDATGEEGKQLLASAKQILVNLGKKDDKEITVDETADTAKIFAQTRFNGDGIVPATSAEDEALQQTILDVIACVGSETDRSGAQGVSLAKVDEFFAAAAAFDAWWKAAESDAANVLPLGDETVAATAAFNAVKAKVDDYFTRARMVAFDARAEAPLNRDPAEYAALAPRELSLTGADVASFPLAHVTADRPLPLDGGLNPAWAEAVRALRSRVIEPLLGPQSELTDAQWATVSKRFAAYTAWRAAKAGTAVEKLGLARARELLAGGARAAIGELIASDKALEPEANAIAALDKLVRYHRDLDTLLNNFVTFRDFYSAKKKALFQAGTLYLDGRSCELCVKVGDAAAHATVATKSGTYLAYCDVVRKGTGEKMVVAAAFTDGDSDSLAVGRNGIFYDRKGNDWDATIVRLVEHPISVRQAFWMPYKRVAKLVGEQIEKFASARDKEVHEHAVANVAGAGESAEHGTHAAVGGPAAPAPGAAPPAAAPPFDIAKFAGIFAAIGLAVGAVGSMLAVVASSFFGLAWWQMPLVLVGVVLAVSGPSMLIAWLKLRRRNIGPILDANGWAVNAHALMNIPFGASLTAVATLPPNAERSLVDPFAEERGHTRIYVAIAIAVVAFAITWQLGYAKTWVHALMVRPPLPAASASASPAPSASAPRK